MMTKVIADTCKLSKHMKNTMNSTAHPVNAFQIIPQGTRWKNPKKFKIYIFFSFSFLRTCNLFRRNWQLVDILLFDISHFKNFIWKCLSVWKNIISINFDFASSIDIEKYRFVRRVLFVRAALCSASSERKVRWWWEERRTLYDIVEIVDVASRQGSWIAFFGRLDGYWIGILFLCLCDFTVEDATYLKFPMRNSGNLMYKGFAGKVDSGIAKWEYTCEYCKVLCAETCK